MTRAYPVDHPSRVAEIRRAASTMAEAEQLADDLVANVALIATEIATNLSKHANNGEVFLSTLSGHSQRGVEILAVDRGPGMSDVAQCLADGYSSANSAGTGMGAISRLATVFDIHSDHERGTVLVARIQRAGISRTTVGAVLKPISGEEFSGDAWVVCEQEEKFGLLVADGLGHGAMAALASAEAVSAYQKNSDWLPRPALERIHSALRTTRGAAVATAYIDRSCSSIRFAGVGNINGVVVDEGKPVVMVSHNGTAGYQSPRLQEFTYPLTSNALLVMHSDGLHTNWNLELYPGLRRRHPAIIAGVLYRDFKRERDDVCVVVARVQSS